MVSLSVGDSWNIPQATAIDNKDGDISHLIEVDDGELNLNQEGTYHIIYTVDDLAGNTGIFVLIVYVGIDEQPSIEYSAYYDSIDGLSGHGLLSELRSIISVYKHRSYDAARDILQISDQDPKNPNNIILVYNRASVRSTWDSGTTWNREHVWPQSKLSGASASDLHNLKPANNSINSSRSNHPFRDSTNSSYGHVSGGWFPGDNDKGDIARILFYMITRYSQLSLSTMANLTTLLKWHLEDPVDDFERNRNEVIYSYQENRNPYIDYPEMVELIW